jgi:hypothetical protein
MYTPGPAITFATAELGLAQNEQFTWRAALPGAVPGAVSLVITPPVPSLSGLP